MLTEFGNRQVSHIFRAAHVIHTYSAKDQHVSHVFMITFFYRQCSMIVLNAGSYIQQFLRGTGKESLLNVDRISTVCELLIWFHCIKRVTNAIDAKMIPLKLT